MDVVSKTPTSDGAGAKDKMRAPLGRSVRTDPRVGSVKRPRIASADGLRAVAVLLVFLTHFVSVFDDYVRAAPWTFRLASAAHDTATKMGVFLFFVLSGYLIYGGLLQKHERYTVFLWRRVKRLYPTFLCVILIYVLLSLLFPGRSRIPTALGPAAVYILENLAFLPGIFNIPPMITPAWSLSYQLAFYLTIPLLVGPLGLRGWQGRQRVLFLLGFALAVAACSLVADRLSVTCVLMFVTGMVLYESQAFLRLESRLAYLGEAAALLSFLFLAWFRNQQDVFFEWPAVQFVWPAILALLMLTVFFWFCFYSLTFQGFLAAGLSWAPLRGLGRVSYSFFLMHALTLNGAAYGLNWILPPSGDNILLFWMMLPASFLLALATSALLFALVEGPFSASAAVSKPPQASAVLLQPEKAV
jgi:peptidoglycan/LPS O-acetylase OafA/YrhL